MLHQRQMIAATVLLVASDAYAQDMCALAEEISALEARTPAVIKPAALAIDAASCVARVRVISRPETAASAGNCNACKCSQLAESPHLQLGRRPLGLSRGRTECGA